MVAAGPSSAAARTGPASRPASPPAESTARERGAEGADGDREPAAPPSVSEAPPGGATAGPASAEAAELVLPPLRVRIEVHTAEGGRVAVVGPTNERVRLGLGAGRTYVLSGPDGAKVRWSPGQGEPALPEAWTAPEPDVAGPAEPSPPAPPPAPVVEEAPARVEARVEVRSSQTWRRFVHPMMSALVPGAGQMMNGEPGKGVAILVSTVGLLTGTILLWPRPDPHEGTGGRADDTRSAAEEVARLAGFAVASGGFGLLYAGQILDAYQGAVGRPPRPAETFFLRIETAGMYTIAAQPGQPSHRLLRDFNVSFMFEPVRRFTLGFSDIGGGRDPSTGRGMSQAGLRVGYRVYDRRRLWLTLSVGGVFQSAGRDRGRGARGDVGGFVYGQLGIRVFVTDSISLALLPRLSIPLATRYYAFGGSLPRFAPSLEMGGGIGVHF